MIAFAAIGLLAFLLRLGLLLFGHPQILIGDEATYLDLAHAFVNGSYYHIEFLPGWPFVLSLILRISDSIFFARLFVIFLGSINCVLTGLIAEKQFGRKAGLMAGLLLSFFPEHIFYSHYLFAEIFLETIFLAVTFMIFRNPISLNRPRPARLAAFLFGLGLFVKHFIVLPFLSLFAALAWHKKQSRKNIALACLCFAAAALLFCGSVAWQTKDPLVFINAPLKSMREWEVDKISKGPDYTARTEFVESHVAQIGPGLIFKRFFQGLGRLWGFETFPIVRLKESFYSSLVQAAGMIRLSVVYYVFVLIFGVAGLIIGKSGPFRTYVILNYVLLTVLCAAFFMVSRYRLPFLSFLVMYAAHFICSLLPKK